MKRVLFILLLCLPVYSQIVIRPLSVPADTRLTGLLAFWNLSEASGTREDTISTNDLTDYNTVLYGTGVIGRAADFELDNSEYLYVADNAAMSMSAAESFAISCWVKMESQPATVGIMVKATGVNVNQMEWLLYWTAATSRLRFATGDGSNRSYVDWGSATGTGTLFFICCWYNTVTDSIYMQVDNGTPLRAEAVYEPYDGTASLVLGSLITNYYDGLIDQAGVWSRELNSVKGHSFADSLYNGGAGWKP